MPKAYVVKKGLGAGHREVLDIHKELTGQEAVPYAQGRGRGFRSDGKTFYSVDKNSTPHQQKEAIVHEATHWLQDNRPELVRDIADAIPVDMREKLAREYERDYKAQEGKTLDPKMRDKEVEALAVGRAFTKFGVARQVMETARSPFVKAIDAIVTKLRGLSAGGRLTNQIVATLRQARELTAAEGVESYRIDQYRPEASGRAAALPEGGKDFLPSPKDAAKQFVKDDVIETGKETWEAFSKAWDGVKRVFAPQARGDAAATTAHGLREVGAERAQRMDRLNAAFDPTEKAIDKLPVAKQREITDLAERGSSQADPALQPVADSIRAVYDDRLRQIQKVDPTFTGLHDYMGHAYKDPAKAAKVLNELATKRPFEGSKGFKRGRHYVYQSDAIAAGLEPVTDNPVAMMRLKVAQMDKYITAREEFDSLRSQGIMRKVAARKVAEMEKKGYAKIEDNIATIFAAPEPQGRAQHRRLLDGPRAGGPNVINNYLSPGLRSDKYVGKLFRGYLAAGNLMNQAQLGLSAFHADVRRPSTRRWARWPSA
jgi:hypothetical protein